MRTQGRGMKPSGKHPRKMEDCLVDLQAKEAKTPPQNKVEHKMRKQWRKQGRKMSAR